MNWKIWTVLYLLFLFFLLAPLVVPVQAVHTGSFLEGCSQFKVMNTVGNANRIFSLGGPNGIAGECTTDHQWELDAGGSIVLTYQEKTESVGPPPTADTVILNIFRDDSSTVVRTLHNGAPPADGSTFTFHATHDGTAGGTPAAGTFRIKVRAIRDGITTDYDCSSDGEEATSGDVDCVEFLTGGLRSRMIASTLTVPSPPADTTYAYGPTGDEQATCEASVSRTVAAAAHEDHFLRAIDSANATIESSPQTEVPTMGSLSFASTIDDTYPKTSANYGCQIDLTGNSPLSGVAWTVFAATGHGTGIVRVDDDTVRRGDMFTADPTVHFDSDTSLPTDNEVTSDFELYNRAENFSLSWDLRNARDERISKSLTFVTVDSDGSTNALGTDTGPRYGINGTWSATIDATNDETGDPKHVRLTATDKSDDSVDSFSISSLYFADTHTQKSLPLTKDDFPDENDGELFTFISGEDTIRTWCHVKGVRKDREIDTGPNEVTILITDNEGGEQENSQHETGADGWTATNTTTPATPPTGQWTATCSVASGGNTGDDPQFIDISTSFTGDKLPRIVFWEVGETVRVWVLIESSDIPVTPDSLPRIKFGRIDPPFSFDEVIDTEWALMTNAMNHTESINGSLYYYDFSPPAPGNYSVVAKAFISGAGVRGQQAFEVPFMSAFETSSGITGTEFGIFLAVALAGVILWHRSTDLVVRAFSALLPLLVSAILLLSMDLSYRPAVGTAGLLGLAGVYLFVRLFYDLVTEAA